MEVSIPSTMQARVQDFETSKVWRGKEREVGLFAQGGVGGGRRRLADKLEIPRSQKSSRVYCPLRHNPLDIYILLVGGFC